MIQDNKHDNGSNLIIDALLARMSELDRFSDDECVIANGDLLPLDVVCVECNDGTKAFDFVCTTFYDGKNGEWSVFSAVDIRIFDELDDIEGNILRTIYETEGTAAREYLTKYLGGKKWF